MNKHLPDCVCDRCIIKTKNAVRCTICQSPADLLHVGIYRCQGDFNHRGDSFVEIFTDRGFKEKEE